MRSLVIGRGVCRAALWGLTAALVALVCATFAEGALAAGDGSLTRVKGKAGCVSVAGRHGCSRGRALDGAGSVAVSPGGGSVYVVAPSSDAVAIFRRAGRTGALRQLQGRAGCVSVASRRGCGRGRALRAPSAILVSPDGRHVYVGSSSGRAVGAIAAFSRDRRTGALRQLQGSAGCVSGRRRAGCGAARGLGFVSSLALGPGGRFLYAGSSAGLAVFRRNARTGRLVQLRGADGCVTAEAVPGCARGRALTGVADIALDRGGDNLYAAAGSVAVFKLAGGVPRQLTGAAGCISELGEGGCTPARTLNGPEALAMSPGAAQLYAAVIYRGAVAILTRDRATGALFQPPGPLGCIRDGGGLDCANARSLEHPGGIELSHDGRNAYITGPGILVVLRRDRGTGALSQLPGKAGCIAPYAGCTDSRGLYAFGLTLSRDGRNAYITDREHDTIAIYRRAR
jgi:DNA-binding beta-propeller fold protein YncE